MNSTLPPNEPERLGALRRYHILDTPPDGTFDHLTAVAAALFRVPIAIVSLVDHDRIWFKSHHGIDLCETGRDPGLCASATFSPNVYYIRDAIHDVRALANPLVAGEFGLRFYAAAPLRTDDGFNLGTFCIIDRKPRELLPSEAEMLTNLAALVMDEMEPRLAAKKVAELEQVERAMTEELRKLNEALRESQERFRDLFDEAPIAYVHEDLDTRLIEVNRAAMRILGIKPEEVAGTFGKSFVPDTPDAQRRLREVLESIRRGTDSSGVVLELVARAIHDHSPRNGRALIKVNCSAVPDSLFESEFFGHVKGAFTGALKDKLGRFELADGGTLFLDEIAEVPLAMQVKLLRVLQEQELERLGDIRSRKVNVRIIAATNRDLKREVDAGRFRQDLFYRLSVFPIQIPPLRERRDDIPPLAAHFVKQIARRMNLPVPRVPEMGLNRNRSPR